MIGNNSVNVCWCDQKNDCIIFICFTGYNKMTCELVINSTITEMTFSFLLLKYLTVTLRLMHNKLLYLVLPKRLDFTRILFLYLNLN